MHTYRLLALDMDGTLLTSDKRISPHTMDAIRQASAHGVSVVASTGRGIAELQEYRGHLTGAIRYGSLLSGGHVFDFQTGQTIFARRFDPETALAVARQGIAEGAMVHVLGTSQSVANRHDIEHMDAFGMGIYQDMFRAVCVGVDDVPTYMATHQGEVLKVNLYHESVASRERSAVRLSGLDACMAFSEQTALEFTPRGVTKALGLEVLCQHLGLTLDQCIAVGDAPNDLDALRAAGLAVAMGNASEEVKRAADVVVADNDHDGIVELVERYLS